jgi:hypothetical protein
VRELAHFRYGLWVRAVENSIRASVSAVSREFEHGNEPKAEEIALHQRFLTLQAQMETAQAEGNEPEVRRLRPLLERARKRWLKVNVRVSRGDY